MNMALREVARVVEPSGPLVVIEPLAEGTLFDALRLVEDETAIRHAAQEAIDRAIESGLLEQTSAMEYVRHERYSGLEEFLDHIVAVDPARAATVEERRSAVEEASSTHGRKSEDGSYVLDQPMLARILRAKARPDGSSG
jgi:ubiquinone/menaquinone biosynthesis C-methylase UbiE